MKNCFEKGESVYQKATERSVAPSTAFPPLLPLLLFHPSSPSPWILLLLTLPLPKLLFCISTTFMKLIMWMEMVVWVCISIIITNYIFTKM